MTNTAHRYQPAASVVYIPRVIGGVEPQMARIIEQTETEGFLGSVYATYTIVVGFQLLRDIPDHRIF